MRRLVLHLTANSAALYVAAAQVPRIEVQGGRATLAVMALILGLANALIRPLIKLFTRPVILATLGLFVVVINALMF